MFDMASIRIVVLCLLISFLMLDAISAGKFVEIKCSKSEIEAQFGTSTLLDCVVQSDYSNVKVEMVIWKLNDIPVLTFDIDNERPDPKDPRFQFANNIRDESNLNVSLLITNTNLSHTGDYHCSVMANRGSDKTQVHLTVKAHYSKPVIKSDPEKVTSDKDFTLTCEAHGGFPQGHIRWVVNEHEWKRRPEEEVAKTPDGLYSLTSKLSFGPDSVFTEFVCEVYNADRVMEGQEKFEIPPLGRSKGSDTKGQSVSHIVAPVLVIGSLIVGLLAAVLVMCRRKHQNVPMAEYPEENNQMVP